MSSLRNGLLKVMKLAINMTNQQFEISKQVNQLRCRHNAL